MNRMIRKTWTNLTATILAAALTLGAVPSTAHSQVVWELEPVVSIGSVSGDVTFGSVSGVAVLSDGRILIGDRHEARVRVFGAEGEPLHAFGGPGAGPGELSETILGPFVVSDSLVMIADLRNMRVSFFGLDPSYISSFRLAQFTPSFRWEVAGGHIFREVRRLPGPPALSEYGPAQSGVILVDVDGTEVRTVATFESSGGVDVSSGRVQTRLYDDREVWGVTGGGGIAIGNSASYDITIVTPEGEEVGRLRRSVTRAAVTPDIREETLRFHRERVESLNLPPSTRGIMSAPSVADSLPVIGQIKPGPAGTTLVRRAAGLLDSHRPTLGRADEMNSRPEAYDVFDQAGAYLGVLEIPPRVRLSASHGDRIYGVALDDFDVQTVVVYRVRRVE